MEVLLLLRLLLAHLVGDFMLQPNRWVTAKNERKQKAPQMYYHVLVVGVLTMIALWSWQYWYIAVLVTASHLAIDIWKSHRPGRFIYFVADQLLHMGVLVVLWLLFLVKASVLPALAVHYFNSVHFWVILLAYYLVSGPMGIAIGLATQKWQIEAGMDKGGLDKAGLWIGRCERVLILTFVIAGQYTALGFLMASKSILRLADPEDRPQKKTEYILVGTLISFASAALVGVVVSYVLGRSQ
jgi:hypothetical protein